MVAKPNSSDDSDKHLVKDLNVTKNTFQYSFESKFVNRIKSASPLTLVSAVTLFSIGCSVVMLSILGNINPLWLASLMSIFGSVSTMVGFYQLYELLSEKSELDNLYKDAIKRVINSQN